ncbi:unnamed protein product [Arabidopsis halleri]
MKVSETLSQGRVMVDERFGSGQKLVIQMQMSSCFSQHTGFRFCRLFQHVKVTS